jgi:O-antigen ligase
VALFVCRALRDPATAHTFGISLILAAIPAAALSIFTYLHLMGLTLPTYESLRVFKGAAAREGIPLNPIVFASLFSYICGMCLLAGNGLLWTLGCILIIITSLLTGSRAPVAMLVASGLVLLMLNGLSSSRLISRVFVWLTIALIIFAVVAGSQVVTFEQMSSITEGRWDLWSVAMQKFVERPLLGYGFESWRDDLASRLPGEYHVPGFAAVNFEGGYHSEYVTMLAEQGLIGFFTVMAFFLFVLVCSWKLAFQRWATWRNGQWALFACVFLLCRAGIESPGLFGYSQEPVDFLAFVFVAIVCSRFSVEEDYVRSTQSPPHLSRMKRYVEEPRYIEG